MSKIHPTAFHQVSIHGYTLYRAVSQCTGRLYHVYRAVTSCVAVRVGSVQNARGAWHPRYISIPSGAAQANK